MPPSVCSARRVLRSLLIACVCLLVFADAQAEETDSTETRETKEGSRREGSLSIRIDEKGIRIEGATGGAPEPDTTSRRIVFRSRDGREYREKGTDIVKFGENVFVSGDELVRGDVVVFGGDVVVEGKVVGNVVVMAGNAEARSGAEIIGDVVVIAGVLEEEPEVLITGERVMFKDFSIPLRGLSQTLGAHGRFFGAFFIPAQFFVSLILSFLIVLFIRDRIVRSQEHVVETFLKSFGAGFLTVFVGTFVVTILFCILVITLIGIPLALVLIVSCLAVFIIARTVFVYAIGRKVSEALKVQTENPFAVVLVGTATLYLPALVGYGISMWPLGDAIGTVFKVLGMLVSLFAYLVGIGALFLSRFGNRSAPAVATAPAAE